MVNAVITARPFHGDDISHAFHNAQQAGIARAVGADGAKLGISKITADRAAMHRALGLGQRLGQLAGAIFGSGHQIKGQPLRCLGAQPRQAGKLVD